MRFELPQIIWIALWAMNLGINACKHGEQTNGKYNFFVASISAGINVWILSAGGFF